MDTVLGCQLRCAWARLSFFHWSTSAQRQRGGVGRFDGPLVFVGSTPRRGLPPHQFNFSEPDVPWPPGRFAARFVLRGRFAAVRHGCQAPAAFGEPEPGISGCRVLAPPGRHRRPHQGTPATRPRPGQRRLAAAVSLAVVEDGLVRLGRRPSTRGPDVPPSGSYRRRRSGRFAGVAAVASAARWRRRMAPQRPPSPRPRLSASCRRWAPRIGQGFAGFRCRSRFRSVGRSVSVMTLRPVTPPTRRRRSTSP